MSANLVNDKHDNISKRSGEHKFQQKIVWLNVILYILLHLSLCYAIYLCFSSAKLQTILFAFVLVNLGNIGITAGSHRLWSHKSYKAKLPLRILLGIFCSIAAQNDIYEWCRDHRVHHKFTETNADPHNIRRGFFFAHAGWLMCRKHPDVATKGKTIKLDDLLSDPVVRFHRKFYVPSVLIFSVYLPIVIPVFFWSESILNAFFIAYLGRYCCSLNITWLVNSAAHKFGDQPFDRYIDARENSVVAFLAVGEGWHNFHHVFPFDYSTSELGYFFNFTKLFIDFMAYIGQAHDMKMATNDMIKSRKLKSGDGTRIADEKRVPRDEAQEDKVEVLRDDDKNNIHDDTGRVFEDTSKMLNLSCCLSDQVGRLY